MSYRFEELLEVNGQEEFVSVVVDVQVEGVPLPHDLIHVVTDRGRLGWVLLQDGSG